jgi:hypothetical protein
MMQRLPAAQRRVRYCESASPSFVGGSGLRVPTMQAGYDASEKVELVTG